MIKWLRERRVRKIISLICDCYTDEELSRLEIIGMSCTISLADKLFLIYGEQRVIRSRDLTRRIQEIAKKTKSFLFLDAPNHHINNLVAKEFSDIFHLDKFDVDFVVDLEWKKLIRKINKKAKKEENLLSI